MRGVVTVDIKFFNWYGGKSRMLKELKCLVPNCDVYVEPFAGSMALLLNISRKKLEIVNEYDANMAILLKIMADEVEGKKLVTRLCQLDYSKEVFEEAKKSKKNNFVGLTDMQIAETMFVLITQSFNSTRAGYSRHLYKNEFDYRSTLRLKLPQVYKRMKGVQVQNGDGVDLVEKMSKEESAFLFLDPPYRPSLRGKGATKVYPHEMTEEDHIRLLEIIRNAKAKILLCGYKAKEGVDTYDEYLLPCGWKCYKLCEVPKSCQNKSEKDIAEEYIWINYELPQCARYVIALKENRTI